MAHVTRVVEYKTLSNGQVAVKLRVDADPASDFSMTLTAADFADAPTREAKLTAGKAQAESLYDASLSAESAAASVVGQAI